MASPRALRHPGSWILALFLFALFAPAARADKVDPAAELVPDRDALIDKIVRGEELDASIRKFTALIARRRAILATAQDVRDRDQPRLPEAVIKAREEYRKSADYAVGSRCTLSVDPANPVRSREHRLPADWGRVVAKERIKLAPKNAFDEGEPVTIYEVEGKGGRWRFRGERLAANNGDFVAEKGDLVLVCRSSESRDRRLPPPYDEQPIIQSGFAVHLAEQPRIAQKKRWNPAHITSAAYHSAIHNGEWKFPPEQFVLSNVEIARDLGDGRYAVDTHNGLFWVMKVPPGLKHRELLAPGRFVWAILGAPEADAQLKTWVFPVQDVEARYIIEK